jgi:decaprenylphospho-beta-D-erythro-pentofuranosid-2-ulose 2-reductase
LAPWRCDRQSLVEEFAGRQSNYIYGASKGAMDIFLQGLRNRLFKSGVRVVTVKPGFVSTPMTAHIEQGPLFAAAKDVGRGIYEASLGGADLVYLPGWWRGIMGVLKALPEPIFKRMSL